MNEHDEQLYRVHVALYHWHRVDGWKLFTAVPGPEMEIGEATARMQFWRDAAQDGEPTRAWLEPCEMGMPLGVQFETNQGERYE